MAPPQHFPLANRLKTRHLLLLVRLDERRSVMHAAEAAGMTQPAASKLLAEIEALLGVPLFVRHARGVEPTPLGSSVILRARNALTELRHAEEALMDYRSGLAGHVALGTVITSATDLVPEAVTRLKRRYPKIVVSIDVDFSENLIARLLAGALDMAIARIHSVSSTIGLAYEGLDESRHGVFARAGHRLARRRSVSIRQLAAQTWVLPPPGNVLRDRLSVLFTQHGLELPQPGIETPALPVITSLLQMSDMVSVLADKVVAAECASGALVRLPIELDLPLGPAGFVTRRGHALSRTAELLLATLREVAAGAPPGAA